MPITAEAEIWASITTAGTCDDPCTLCPRHHPSSCPDRAGSTHCLPSRMSLSALAERACLPYILVHYRYVLPIVRPPRSSGHSDRQAQLGCPDTRGRKPTFLSTSTCTSLPEYCQVPILCPLSCSSFDPFFLRQHCRKLHLKLPPFDSAQLLISPAFITPL